MFASTLYIAGAEDVGIGGETKKKVRKPPETTISEDPIPEPPFLFSRFGQTKRGAQLLLYNISQQANPQFGRFT